MTVRIRRSIVLTVVCLSALTAAMTAQRGPATGGRTGPTVPTGGRVQAPGRSGQAAETGRPIQVLFLGMDQERPHNPAKMFPYLARPLARRGIQLTYVADQAQALNADKLK